MTWCVSLPLVANLVERPFDSWLVRGRRPTRGACNPEVGRRLRRSRCMGRMKVDPASEALPSASRLTRITRMGLGMLQSWTVGIRIRHSHPSFHHSINPIFHYSTIPAFHHSYPLTPARQPSGSRSSSQTSRSARSFRAMRAVWKRSDNPWNTGLNSYRSARWCPPAIR